jgi:hypothetical protein
MGCSTIWFTRLAVNELDHRVKNVVGRLALSIAPGDRRNFGSSKSQSGFAYPSVLARIPSFNAVFISVCQREVRILRGTAPKPLGKRVRKFDAPVSIEPSTMGGGISCELAWRISS